MLRNAEYDVFISYSHKDVEWVRNWLLPRLDGAGLQVCIDFRDFELGIPSLVNMERAVERSRKTLLVLSPHWVESAWTVFENLLGQTQDPIGLRRSLVPLLLTDCKLPPRLEMLTHADFRMEAIREVQLNRVLERLGAESARKAVGKVEYTRDGEEICVDRRWEVVTFRRMLHRDRALRERILAFQVPGGKGKTRLLRRFGRICEEEAKRSNNIFHAYLDLRDNPPSPYGLAHQIVSGILRNADILHPNLIEQLEPMKNLIDDIKRFNRDSILRNQTRESLEIDFRELAQILFTCIKLLSHEFTFVIVIDTFEDAGDGGEWFLRFCVPESYDIKNLVIVLAGRSHLSRLENSYEVLFRSMLEPMLDLEDFQLLAKHHDLEIDRHLAREVIERCRGDIQTIDMCLGTFKVFPEFTIPDLIERILGLKSAVGEYHDGS